MTSTGSLIRQARLAAGLSQAELARRSGTSQPTLSLYESGTRDPHSQTLRRILRATGHDLTLTQGDVVLTPSADELKARGEALTALLAAVPAFPPGQPRPAPPPLSHLIGTTT